MAPLRELRRVTLVTVSCLCLSGPGGYRVVYATEVEGADGPAASYAPRGCKGEGREAETGTRRGGDGKSSRTSPGNDSGDDDVFGREYGGCGG